MNKSAVVLIASIIMLSISSTLADTYVGNLSLASQAEVDAFNYSDIAGSLTITGADIVDLSPLSALISVGAYLSISHNSALVVVDGFDNLTSVGWGIFVHNNANLASFSGFDALLATGDNIEFWYNDSLMTVSGFGSLHTAGWSLEFGGNPVLTSIPAFESLETITSSLFILDNASLSSITGFNALRYVDWSFDIIGNSALSDLCGFYNYCSANNPYTGGGSCNISENGPDLPSPSTIQDMVNDGPCQIPTEEMIDNLISDIDAMALPNGISNSLMKSLAKAKTFLKKGAGTKQLEAFVDDIESLRSRGKIDADTADELAAAVPPIIDSINF